MHVYVFIKLNIINIIVNIWFFYLNLWKCKPNKQRLHVKNVILKQRDKREMGDMFTLIVQ